jgi:hypothetical protein
VHFQLQQLSGTARLRKRSFQILIYLIPISVVRQSKPVLVLLQQQQSPTTVSHTPVFRTPSALILKLDAFFRFLQPLPPTSRLPPTYSVHIHRRCVRFRFFPTQLSAARVDAARFK